MMWKRLFLLFTALMVPAAALAEETVPPLKSLERISWAVKCAGPMPVFLIASLAAICALTIAAVVYYKKAGGGDET